MPGPSPTSDRAAAVTALVGGALLSIPLWVGKYLPLLDLPQHLAIATVFLRHADPTWTLAPYYEPQPWELTPYWGHYVALVGLGRFMSVETAARVFLTLYVVALPFSAMALASALGRPARMGLLALPLALNANLYYGFIAYCASTVLLFWALALLARQVEAPSLPRAAGIAALAAAIFFTHVQSFAFLLLAAPLLAACGDAPLKRARRAWPLVPATLGLFLPWLYLSTTPQPGADRYFPALDETRSTYASTWERLVALPDSIAGSFQDRSDDALLMTWALAVGAAALAGRGEAGPVSDRRALALLLAAAACYFLLPLSIQGQWNISQRFAWLAALLLPLLARSAPRWIPSLVLSLAAATSANAAWHHRAFDREAAPFEKALAKVTPGAKVLGLVFETRGAVMERWPYLHFEQYAVVRGGGMAAHSFTANSPMPVRLRRAARVPAPEVWHPRTFDYDLHGEFFDYFLVRGTTIDAIPLWSRPDAVVEVYRGRDWRVYRRLSEYDASPQQAPAPPGR
jgi:hypothetical protein